MDGGARPGVYMVPYSDCPNKYFGESGRGLSVRPQEHKYAVSRHDKNNAFYKHKLDTCQNGDAAHAIDWESAKLLHASNNWYDRLVVESSLIKNYPNFNGMQSTLGIDQFSSKLVVQSIPNLNL